MSSYAQRYLDELLRNATKDTPTDAPKVIGEISATTAKQQHIAVFVELGPGRCLGTTAGLSARPMPLPVAEGFQYFELCALTQADSPGVLWLLSNVGNYMLATASPFFYGDPSITASEGGEVPKPKPFLAYQTLMFGGDGERLLFVPRWRFLVPEGPPVEVVESLPITDEQWAILGPMELAQRAAWVAALGDGSRLQWQRITGAKR